MSWSTVVNNGYLTPGGTKHFNSYSQPSVNGSGLVAFRARTQGESQPVRGVYTRNTQASGAQVTTVAAVGDAVPAPNNSGGTFNEFPSFPRVDAVGPMVATRGQSTPVWTYQLNGTDTKVGTSGVYATPGGGPLMTGASLLGNVPGFAADAVPGATAGTRFDQFPGAPAVDGTTITFKGNYTEGGLGKTGVYFRNLADLTQPVGLIANTATRIPNQPADGTATFGSTAPPSSAGGRTAFVGLDNEDAPTAGGIYLADTTSSPTLHTVVGIGADVPDTTPTEHFTNFGEGLSFDGRFVGFWGAWGTDTQTITLPCPTDGNADLLAYCNQTYPDGYTTRVPVHQGIFVYDSVTDHLYRVTATGARFAGFQYWVFSGRPPGTGGGDETTLEPARWRSSAFVAVSGLTGGDFQVAFKATPVGGGSGVYVSQRDRSQEQIVTAIDTSMSGTSIDPAAPAGSTVMSVGLERDGFRGRYLALTASMLDPTTSESWAGVYLSKVAPDVNAQAITITSTQPADPVVGDSYTITATADSGLPVTYSLDPSTTDGACVLSGSTVHFEHEGTCVIDADQSGDATWTAAPRVQQSFAVHRVATSVGVTLPSSSVFGQTTHPVATVATDRGAPAGSVQFLLDGTALGAPVPVSGSRAVGPDLVGAAGQPLAVGVHQLSATFTPQDANTFAPSQASSTQVVNKAATKLDLTVRRSTLTASVSAVPPGAGTPSGYVSFAVRGRYVGRATLQQGRATLTYTVRPGTVQHIAATYAGDGNFTGSSASTARHDPTIKAVVTSRYAKTGAGWYRSAVTVRYQCTANGSPLTTPCPKPVSFTRGGAAQSVTRTITALDGGAATVHVSVNIDLRRPAVSVTGIRNGAVYFGQAPKARCVGRDPLSGIATCTVTRRTSGERTTFWAVAVDRAGNRSTLTGQYRTLKIFLVGARYVGGAFRVAVNRTYTLVAYAPVRPIFYDAQTYPGRPTVRDQAMYRTGSQRWALGVTMTPSLRNHPDWNLGVKIGRSMQVVRIHVG